MAQKAQAEDKNLAHVQKETIPELESLKEFWKKHGDKLSYVLLAVCVCVIGWQQYGKWHEKSTEGAFMEFTAARTPDTLEQFIENNKSSDLAVIARLRLGGIYYAEAKYANAKEVYEALLRAKPRHPQAGIASVGVAFCSEALGDAEKAAAQFKAFADANPDSYLAPMARVGHGRALILAGKKDEGKQALDLFITECAGTDWARQADEVLRNRNRLAIPPVGNVFGADTFDISAFLSPDPEPADGGEIVITEELTGEE